MGAAPEAEKVGARLLQGELLRRSHRQQGRLGVRKTGRGSHRFDKVLQLPGGEQGHHDRLYLPGAEMLGLDLQQGDQAHAAHSYLPVGRYRLLRSRGQQHPFPHRHGQNRRNPAHAGAADREERDRAGVGDVRDQEERLQGADLIAMIYLPEQTASELLSFEGTVNFVLTASLASAGSTATKRAKSSRPTLSIIFI